MVGFFWATTFWGDLLPSSIYWSSLGFLDAFIIFVNFLIISWNAASPPISILFKVFQLHVRLYGVVLQCLDALFAVLNTWQIILIRFALKQQSQLNSTPFSGGIPPGCSYKLLTLPFIFPSLRGVRCFLNLLSYTAIFLSFQLVNKLS